MHIVRQTAKPCLVFILVCLLTIGAGPTTGASAASAGFHISGRFLLDANGNNFVMRGVNHPHTWFPAQTGSFKNIKAKGANTVRVVLSSGHVQGWTKNTASDVANVIKLCKSNKLVCVLEVHDTTGYDEEAGAATLAQAVGYWKSIKSVLIGQEAYVIINIGNEPFGNLNPARWIAATKNAILAMRAAGFEHTLMVDAPNWGQDWQFIMRDNAASVFDADPQKNTLFSIHMYGVFDTPVKVQDYVSAFVGAGLPLAIGEFGWKHSDGNPNEDAIMAVARAQGIGYLGWSWSGNCCGGAYLDMVKNFNSNRMTWWGYRIFGGENGICPTSEEASVFGGSTGIRACTFAAKGVGSNDGWILESTETSNQGGSANRTASTFNLGDDDANRQYRAVLHFSTSLLPNNAVITRVRLMIRLQGVAGTNPFTTHGGLRVDIRKPYFGPAASLVPGDFQAAASKVAVGTIGPAPANGWHVALLNVSGFPFINLMGATQFRLRFAKDDNNDLGTDIARFYTGNAPPANRPTLMIEYTVP